MILSEHQLFIYELKLLSTIIRSRISIDSTTLTIIGNRHYLIEKTLLPLVNYDSLRTPIIEDVIRLIHRSRQKFLSDIQESFENNNKDFICKLKAFGLTNNEIKYCCLLTLGLKGKDIGIITNNPNHYNNSCNIRYKLGLHKSNTNLSIFLRDMFRNTKQ